MHHGKERNTGTESTQDRFAGFGFGTGTVWQKAVGLKE